MTPDHFLRLLQSCTKALELSERQRQAAKVVCLGLSSNPSLRPPQPPTGGFFRVASTECVKRTTTEAVLLSLNSLLTLSAHSKLQGRALASSPRTPCALFKALCFQSPRDFPRPPRVQTLQARSLQRQSNPGFQARPFNEDASRGPPNNAAVAATPRARTELLSASSFWPQTACCLPALCVLVDFSRRVEAAVVALACHHRLVLKILPC